jgi:hypothetical protein
MSLDICEDRTLAVTISNKTDNDENYTYQLWLEDTYHNSNLDHGIGYTLAVSQHATYLTIWKNVPFSP